ELDARRERQRQVVDTDPAQPDVVPHDTLDSQAARTGRLDRRQLDGGRSSVQREYVPLRGGASVDVGDLEDHRQLTIGDVGLGEREVHEALATLRSVQRI